MLITCQSIQEPLDGIHYKQSNTNAVVRTHDLGPGTLYVTESAVYWIGAHGNGFTLQYPSISLHAISRDLTCFNCECIYLMIEAEFEGITFCRSKP
uniref:Methylosome subunit pICln n=1 Tax=Romanomermis culicivorax TaxID=13658 RepID=A0A915JM58_ROMCU